MKKLILLALAAVMMAGCVSSDARCNHRKELVSDYKPTTIEYQGCEYMVVQSYYNYRVALTHKGNCRFCKERRDKEMKELVKAIKGE